MFFNTWSLVNIFEIFAFIWLLLRYCLLLVTVRLLSFLLRLRRRSFCVYLKRRYTQKKLTLFLFTILFMVIFGWMQFCFICLVIFSEILVDNWHHFIIFLIRIFAKRFSLVSKYWIFLFYFTKITWFTYLYYIQLFIFWKNFR